MHNNKAILDEAARSVRRTFIGSVAGSAGMLAVVGAAGAYGMPERLTAQALTAAMAKFNMRMPSPSEQVTLPVPQSSTTVVMRTVKVAENLKPRTPSPVTDVVDDVAPPPVAPQVAPTVAAPPARPAVVRETVVALAAPIIESVPPAEAAQVAMPAFMPTAEPTPTVTASLAPRAVPEVAAERPFIFAPMVFETPRAADAQTLTELPKTEIVEPVKSAPSAAAPVAEPVKSVAAPAAVPAPVRQASLEPQAETVEYPKLVSIALPLPRPPLTPAQRLDLTGKEYDKAERCLAQAVYFEARNEPVRGQAAVAQVVLNRVFSPYYPKDVCGVVYQNAHRHLSCQFTFACDGKPEAVNERGPWARANRIAKQALDAKVWLPEVNKATHYHAAYVRPNWIRDMKVMVRYGLHTFYRPRNWGDGSNEAHWGTASNSAKPIVVASKKARKS